MMLPMMNGWTIPTSRTDVRIQRYSTVGDILSYLRCRRQYGMFGVRGFESDTQTQRYFGVLVHDVMDRIYWNYIAGIPLPDETEVEQLVRDAHIRLRRAGIRARNMSEKQRLAAALIYRFVVLAGGAFFPNVRKTEYHLERALTTPTNTDYILEGVVDVLSGAVSHALGLPFYTQTTDIEIWDYKAGHMPDATSTVLQDYQYQMLVYAELYRLQTGDLPDRCVLVFLGELDDDSRWDPVHSKVSDYPRLLYTIEPKGKSVAPAIARFHKVVEEIENEKQQVYDQQWLAPTHPVDQATCADCPLRTNCSGYQGNPAERTAPL